MTQAIAPETSSTPTANHLRWTSADLELLPEHSNRYEIIDGELYVTRAPHWKHQTTCGRFFAVLDAWSIATKSGETALGAGVLLGDSDDVIPDVVWVSQEKYEILLDEAGHLRGAPDLAIEVLSAGTENEKRDRELKLKLYSSRGVLEYWIADWRSLQIQIYRRENGILKLVLTLFANDILTSPLLPEFSCPISRIFA
jgi:Uma2 family endonuclease